MTDSPILRQRIICASRGQLISPSDRSAVHLLFCYSSRFISSPKLVLKKPFNYNRENPEDYVCISTSTQIRIFLIVIHAQSLVERKTLSELGVSSLPDWKITGKRIRFMPPNNQKKDARILVELERLKAHAAKTGGVAESIHINGIAEYNGFRG
jgi:hypothetical protein